MIDTIVRCLLRDPPLRVVAVSSTEVAREAARRHRAVGGAQVALGRGATAGLLLATLTKGGEQVTLQILGNGPLGSLLVDATDAGNVRVSLRNPDVLVPGPQGWRVSVADGIGKNGVVSVARDLGMRFQSTGQALMVSGEIDEDIENYLTTSEQIDSALGCEVLLGNGEVAASAGVLVQCMPGEDAAEVVAGARARLRAGALTELVARGITEPADLARLLVGAPGDRLEVLDARPVRFHCPCSRERVQRSLELLDPEDLQSMVDDREGAEVTCNFCRAVYQLDPAELEVMLATRRERART
jgi:molecular chaperone Hsp33